MLKKHTISIKHALDGLKYALTTQPNYRIHILLSVISLFAAWFLKISREELLIIIVMIGFGMALETVNTAIEQTTDAIDLNTREDIRIAKDVSAAAMLIFAVISAIVAGIIFLPRLF